MVMSCPGYSSVLMLMSLGVIMTGDVAKHACLDRHRPFKVPPKGGDHTIAPCLVKEGIAPGSAMVPY